ncbi:MULTISPECIES: DUF6243 family protein [Streptomyces]|uniref:DUF6243 family protein n=1 Tax=Streptomyces TaxID=1883 RepID=UPI001CCDBFA8|nr:MULTISPECIES: DUF6243 family protein [Streptomyces]MBZ6140573.1 hypothetical protein [Streptomyces olivaceus]MBZ6168335.1 hypothetical protein [Streptomyces olivaceus]WFB83564.1 DUF6243 family protein [Streptomyces olivaceus]WGK45867.1 DUF6243 family protein [Streptomyces sp. B146]
MTRGGSGNMPGVGGTRRKLGREALRGAGRAGRIGGAPTPQEQKRELLRTLRERRRPRQSPGAADEAS